MLDAQTYMAFDFGLKHIGVAVGQTLTLTAQPLTSLKANAGEPNWQAINDLIKIWQPQALVVGIPFNMDGTEQPLSSAARKFAEHLHQHTQLPIHFMDERLSTVEARAKLFEQGGYKKLSKKNIDSTAAQLILESWLNSYSIQNI